MDITMERTIEVLNDLILINSDSSTVYEKEMKQIVSDDPELAHIFKTMAADSRKYLYELAGHLDPSGQEFIKVIPPTSGRIYQSWSNEKRITNGKDRNGLLEFCETMRKATEKAYEEAMKEEVTEKVKQIIAAQKNSLKRSYASIKELQQVQHVE